MFRNFKDKLNISRKALVANKARSILTILGIVIGVFTVIVVLSIGEGFRFFVLKQIEFFGNDIIQVETKVPNTSKTSSSNATTQALGATIITLKSEDAEAVVRQVANTDMYYPGIMGQELASYRSEIKKVLLFGTNANAAKMTKGGIEEGDFLSKEDEIGNRRVVVLGSEVRDDLFGIQPALGELIKIKGQSYKVIGVMKKQGNAGFFNPDKEIYVPVTTMQKQIMGIDYVTIIVFHLKDVSLAQETAKDIALVMRQQHQITNPDKDDFAVNTMEEAQTIIDSVIGGITLLLGAVAALSLIVGGVGIMNIMLVSVRERTREIGLRKAVGATKKDILYQFVIEAVVLTLAGGIIGIFLGALLSLIGSFFIGRALGGSWPLTISVSSVLLGFFVSAVTGLVFGIYPAKKAAGLTPIEALRS